MKSRLLRAQDFDTPLALKTAKRQHLPALEVYKNQSNDSESLDFGFRIADSVPPSLEVLNGVSVDGVGGIFPFFFFVLFFRFSSLFFIFFVFSYSPRGQGQTTAIFCKNGEFHSDPVCTDPMQNFPTKVRNVGRHFGPKCSCL